MAKNKPSKSDRSHDVDLLREQTRALIAKWGLVASFVGVVLSALFGYFQEEPRAFTLTAGFAGFATWIMRSYFANPDADS